ncbi:MAG: hypothetical protein JO205_01285 [Pseudolabrys sp.]|nr:hypothetical protein [Pseudolabrys sp.]MBV9259981.1 hypothetical protein [Pseudolabrys sp.]
MACFAAAAALLAACADNSKPDVVKNIPPTDYRNEIGLLLMHTLGDPTNIRNASVTDPLRNGDGPYFVCVRYTARDSPKTYGQPSNQVAYFFDGRLNQISDTLPEQCAKAVYKPYPELEKLCQAKKCE